MVGPGQGHKSDHMISLYAPYKEGGGKCVNRSVDQGGGGTDIIITSEDV